ncbi:MAG: nitroreductase family protein, partial [Alistipes sp.]|nr:nitroreductase family protein [Alistipes sp.]
MKVLKSALTLAVAIFAIGCVTTSEDVNINIVKAKDKAVMEVIMSRRSIRDYKSEAVDREQMAKVMECGIYAPSAMNSQSWAVRVVDAPDFIEGVTNIAVAQHPEIKQQEGFRNIFRNAPTVAFIAVPDVSYSGEFDSGLLAQNMMLSAWSMGIGSCCLGSVIPVMNSEEAKPYMERLNFPEGYHLQIAIAFGYP